MCSKWFFVWVGIVHVSFAGTICATTYTVTNTNDSGDGSLSWAIDQANTNPGKDIINFNIPGTGPHRIQPITGLPAVSDPVTIDGYTQPGSSPNTNPVGQGLNTVLKIILDGSSSDGGIGLDITAGSCTVRGLVIQNFGIYGIDLWASGSNIIRGNFIGTNSSGTASGGNFHGIMVEPSSSNNIIGGTTADARNLISGNIDNGIVLYGSTGNVVQGNLIGTDRTGMNDLGNSGPGLMIDAGNSIGGKSNGAGNTIAFNYIGVSVFESGNTILSNSISSNDALGIDLIPEGVTPNDVWDGDAGANDLQNYPVLNWATPHQVQGTINSTPNTEFGLEFFSNNECDPSGYGEGETYLGDLVVQTDGDGNASFGFPFPFSIAGGQFITATATDPSGNTSEFSQCIEVQILCALETTSPNGGEIWVAGETEAVTWNSENTSGTVIIEYSTDGGYVWQLVTGGTEDDGWYDWAVPATPSDNCKIIVCDVRDSTCCDRSDGFFTIHAECDFAITHIAVSNPVSVDYASPVRVAITNLSFMDISTGDAYIDILDQWGESIFFEGPVRMDRLDPDPFFLFPEGDTLYFYQYNWVPTEAGNFYMTVSLEFMCDTTSYNDTLDIGPVTVSESGTGFIGYFDPYSAEVDTVPPQPDAGPAVRFSIPDNMSDANLQNIVLGVSWGSHARGGGGDLRHQLQVGSTSLFTVYLYGVGENDSSFGAELIEPFEVTQDNVDEDGRIVIDLTGRPEYGNLMGLHGDFWVHIRATEETEVGFLVRPLLPDTAFHRNWMYYAEGGSRSRGGAIEGHAGEPEIVRVTKGWEENIGITFSPSWLEGVRGDVNNDGSINILDVLATINHILGTVPLSGDGLMWADCNGDVEIDILDA
ncbi:MAG: hypothetical protein JSV84_17585, partial [Gemmatimonadota bacterium]